MYASVMHSSSDPGGGWVVMTPEGVGGAWGISPVVVVYSDALSVSPEGVIVVYGIVSVAGVGGGSGGGRAVVQATDGGGTTTVGPRHRHSLLVTLVSVMGVSVVRSVTESYSKVVQSI